MSHQLTHKILGSGVFLAWLIGPAEAHNVAVTDDVAGVWHIEPNHSPRAGEPSVVWIALTRKGGEILPLEQASCTLEVYTQPRTQSDKPILSPTLKAISAEQYQGIPGSDVIFPRTGLYQLQLDCTPKVAEDFTPFQMNYEVTVASGRTTPQISPSLPVPSPAPSAPITSSPAPAQPSAPIIQAVGLGMGVIALGIILGIVRRLFRKR